MKSPDSLQFLKTEVKGEKLAGTRSTIHLVVVISNSTENYTTFMKLKTYVHSTHLIHILVLSSVTEGTKVNLVYYTNLVFSSEYCFLNLDHSNVKVKISKAKVKMSLKGQNEGYRITCDRKLTEIIWFATFQLRFKSQKLKYQVTLTDS